MPQETCTYSRCERFGNNMSVGCSYYCDQHAPRCSICNCTKWDYVCGRPDCNFNAEEEVSVNDDDEHVLGILCSFESCNEHFEYRTMEGNFCETHSPKCEECDFAGRNCTYGGNYCDIHMPTCHGCDAVRVHDEDDPNSFLCDC